jgi:crotonobetaine/carnitine-CoA ligase
METTSTPPAEGSLHFAADYGEPTTLPAVLRNRAETSADARFVTFEGTHLSYGESLSRARRAAGALASLGVGKGDKVALMLTNSLEFLDLWFGASLLGAVLVPVNAGLKGEGLRYIVEHSEAGVLVADSDLVETVEQSIPSGEGPAQRFAHGDARDGYGALDDLLGGNHPDADEPTLDPGDLASILYTSGTTGLPKGVMNCHNSYPTAALEFTRRYVRVREDDVLYTSLPLFHVNAQSLTTCGSLVSGRPMVLASRFSASRFFDDLRAHDATVFNYIGAMLTMLYKQPARDDDADNPVRLTVGGAAPAELWTEFERRFGLKILEIYGLTETATFCLGSPPDQIRVGTVGQPVGWSEVRVEDEDGDEAADGESGEITIRSKRPHTLFLGYYKNREATDEAMKGGWFHSGDRGSRDADGYFIFKDRLKDSIRRRGENISSYELERIINQHPAVAESAAFGVPSELGEDEVMVAVVRKPDTELEAEELVEFCTERMAAFMIPRYVDFRDQLPKTATERVQKYQLRDKGPAGAWDRLAESEGNR